MNPMSQALAKTDPMKAMVAIVQKLVQVIYADS